MIMSLFCDVSRTLVSPHTDNLADLCHSRYPQYSSQKPGDGYREVEGKISSPFARTLYYGNNLFSSVILWNVHVSSDPQLLPRLCWPRLPIVINCNETVINIPTPPSSTHHTTVVTLYYTRHMSHYTHHIMYMYT